MGRQGRIRKSDHGDFDLRFCYGDNLHIGIRQTFGILKNVLVHEGKSIEIIIIMIILLEMQITGKV